MGRSVLHAVLLVCAGLGGMMPACAETVPVEAAVAASPVLEDRYPRASVAFSDGVVSYPDLIFATPPGFRPLRLDLYKPARSATRPLVVYVHGGGWQSGHTRHAGAFANWPDVLASLASRGYVVASIEYRLSDEATFPAAIQDVKSAIRWLRSRSIEFGIDPQRALIWGGSAGGQLAALAATTCGLDRLAPMLVPDTAHLSAPLAAQTDCVQGLVTWYAVFDFSTTPLSVNQAQGAASPVNKYLGCNPSTCRDLVALASPTSHVSSATPPTLLVHGELDKVVPVVQSREFYAALQAKKIPAELMVIPGVDHSFIGANADVTRRASLAALSKTFEFIDATVGSKRP